MALKSKADDKQSAVKTTNAKRAYDEFRRMVLNNELPAGSVHFEPELAEMLGVNRVLAHEAAMLLDRDGLVEVRPRRGVRILPISANDMREIYDILTELEALAAETAAGRELTAEQLERLEEPLDAMDSAIEADELQAWAEADQRFHNELVRASGNTRLENIVNQCMAQSHRVRLMTMNLRPRPTKSNDDHRQVVNAIKAGDAAKAREIHHAHRRNARDMLLALLEEYGLQKL